MFRAAEKALIGAAWTSQLFLAVLLVLEKEQIQYNTKSVQNAMLAEQYAQLSRIALITFALILGAPGALIATSAKKNKLQTISKEYRKKRHHNSLDRHRESLGMLRDTPLPIRRSRVGSGFT